MCRLYDGHFEVRMCITRRIYVLLYRAEISTYRVHIAEGIYAEPAFLTAHEGGTVRIVGDIFNVSFNAEGISGIYIS